MTSQMKKLQVVGNTGTLDAIITEPRTAMVVHGAYASYIIALIRPDTCQQTVVLVQQTAVRVPGRPIAANPGITLRTRAVHTLLRNTDRKPAT